MYSISTALSRFLRVHVFLRLTDGGDGVFAAPMLLFFDAGDAGARSTDARSGLERLTVLGVLGEAVELSLSLTLRFLLASPREPPLDVDDATDARRTALPLTLRGDAGVELVGVTSCVGVLTLRKLRSH